MTVSCSCFSEWMTGTLFQQQRLLFFLPQLTLACPFFGEVGSQGHQGERCGSQPTRSPHIRKMENGRITGLTGTLCVNFGHIISQFLVVNQQEFNLHLFWVTLSTSHRKSCPIWQVVPRVFMETMWKSRWLEVGIIPTWSFCRLTHVSTPYLAWQWKSSLLGLQENRARSSLMIVYHVPLKLTMLECASLCITLFLLQAFKSIWSGREKWNLKDGVLVDRSSIEVAMLGYTDIY